MAVAALFAGGHGALGLDDAGRPGWGGGNFLVRSAHLFRARRLATAIVDAPTDRAGPGLYHFRDTPEHAADVAAVIRDLRRRFGLPVVLIGTSRGTESVANAAVRLHGGEALGKTCNACHYHGVNGIESRVVGDVIAWLEANVLAR